MDLASSISPLKALINDQYRRLGSLGDALEMPVTPWHGDVPQKQKRRRLGRTLLAFTDYT